jgi:hypothetical protein
MGVLLYALGTQLSDALLHKVRVRPSYKQSAFSDLQRLASGFTSSVAIEAKAQRPEIDGYRERDTEEASVASEEQTKMDGPLSAAVLIRRATLVPRWRASSELVQRRA